MQYKAEFREQNIANRKIYHKSVFTNDFLRKYGVTIQRDDK